MIKKLQKGAAAGLCVMMLSAMPAPALAQSLWADSPGGSESMLFADRKARNVGDILTIVISETASTSMVKGGSNSKSGSTNLNAGVGIFGFLAEGIWKPFFVGLHHSPERIEVVINGMCVIGAVFILLAVLFTDRKARMLKRLPDMQN